MTEVIVAVSGWRAVGVLQCWVSLFENTPSHGAITLMRVEPFIFIMSRAREIQNYEIVSSHRLQSMYFLQRYLLAHSSNGNHDEHARGCNYAPTDHRIVSFQSSGKCDGELLDHSNGFLIQGNT